MKIMVCYENFKGSENIMRVAIQQAKALDAAVHLVTVLIVSTLDEERCTKKAQEELNKAKESLEIEGVACKAHILIRGVSEGEDLLRFAEINGMDEIIIGAKKRSKLEKMILGSATQTVILQAHCPVITVKAA